MSEAKNESPIELGGAGKFSSLEGADEKSRGIVRMATTRWPRRWAGITPEAKSSFAGGLHEASEAMRSALKAASSLDESTRAAGVIASIARTAVAMEGQVQEDEHLEDKNRRLDAGQLTERFEGVAILVPGRPLPLSEAVDEEVDET